MSRRFLNARRAIRPRGLRALRALFVGGGLALAAVTAAAAAQPVLDAGMASPVYRNYALHCMGCHGPSGDGVAGMIPPLKNSLGWFMHTQEGRKFAIKVPGASNSSLSDAELADVMNFILGELNAGILPAAFKPYDTAEITAARRPAYIDVKTVRHGIVRQLLEKGYPASYDY